jgi:hypothetical protein
MLIEVYNDTDVEYMRTFKLEGAEFKADSARLFDELKPLVTDGPGWTYVKPFSNKRNGRGAILALKLQAEGTAATKIRKSAAYNAINSCRFRGNKRDWTLANFIDSHAAARAELLQLKGPVSETKKVTDFLAGILCSKLEMAKAHILGMDVLNENFSACQNYIKTYHLNVMESEKTQRIVSQVQQSTRTSSNQGSYQPKKKARKGQISNKEWNLLTESQKQVSRDKRELDKLQKKRSVSKIVMISPDPVTPPNAGTEFGRNAHKKGKK